MGRWKDNGQGQAYYDAQDSGPDQIAPPADIAAAGGSGSAGNIYAPPTRTPPMTPNAGNNGGWGSEGPGGIGGNAEDPNANKPVLNAPGSAGNIYSPPTSGDQSMWMTPGQNGQWSMGGGKAEMIQNILAQLQAKYGHSTGLLGQAARNVPQVQNKIQAALQAPRRGGFASALGAGGMALGSLGQ